MNIAGLVRTSTLDFPGELCAVVFTPGCNFDCFYCHNRHLLEADTPLTDSNQVMAYLKQRAALLDGVVVSGGEPTLQPDLAAWLAQVRAMGYKTKLDTNGSQPAVIDELLGNGLLDYVAMDYKAPWERYEELTGGNAAPVRETLMLLQSAPIGWELRCTAVGQLSTADLAQMARDIAPAPAFVIQPFRMPEGGRAEDRFRLAAAELNPPQIKERLEAVLPYQPHARIR